MEKDQQNTVYRFERLSRDNIHHLVILYLKVFHRKITLASILKKYDTQYLGVSYLGYIAVTPNGDAAAYYGVIPCVVTSESQTILAAQSGDTMTHPAHQRKGLFVELANKTYELAKNFGVQFVFGFPNQNSFQGFQSLHWKFMPDKLQLFRLKANPLPFAKVIVRVPILRKFYLDLLKSKIFGSLDPEEFFPPDSTDGIQHNQAFLQYKQYGESFFIDIGHAHLWAKVDGSLRVGLVKPLAFFQINHFLKKLKKYAWLAGCGDIVFITSKHTDLYHQLISALSPMDLMHIGFYVLTEKQWNLGSIRFEYCDIDTF